MAPSWTPDQKGVKVQIVDVFGLRLATGYEKDPKGRLNLLADSSLSQGRTWSLAKACQLVRNDSKPERWVVLHRHKKAWGLFWAGGGLDLCRDELKGRLSEDATGAIVPATPEALLRLVLSMEEVEEREPHHSNNQKRKRKRQSIAAQTDFPWRAIAITSLIWLIITSGISLSSSLQLNQQRELLEQLIKTTKTNGEPIKAQ